MLRQSYDVDVGYIISLFEVIGTVAAYFVHSCYVCGSCTVPSGTVQFRSAQCTIMIYVTDINIVTLAKHRLRAP